MNLLTAEGLAKTYADRTILEDINFTIESEDKIGVIGANGAGKSTLLRIVAGLEQADRGSMMTARGLRIEYLPQEPVFPAGLSILDAVLNGPSPQMIIVRDYTAAESRFRTDPENVKFQQRFYELSRQMDESGAWSLEAEAKAALTRLGIQDYQREASILSGGQQKRVALAAALVNPADLLLLDEPTNHLDPAAVEWLEQYLKSFKGALMMVTHDRYFLERVTNVMFEIDQTRLFRYQANYERWLELKAERQEMEAASWAKHQNTMRRELAWMRQGAKARSTKQQARIQRFEELQEREGPGAQGQVSIEAAASRLGRKTLELRDVSKAWGSEVLFHDFSWLLSRDERLGLIGPNGSGKTTLLNVFAGTIEPDNGERIVGSTVKIGYFRQENEEMDESLRVIDYIKETAEFVKTASGELSAAMMLELFLFPPTLQWTPIHKLSGGEKRRLYLLKILMEQPNILLLDEPTNDLDIMTLSVLEDYLQDFPGAVVVVSHDRYFLDRVVKQILALEDDGKIRHFRGDFQDYLLEIQDKPSVPAVKATSTSSTDAKTPPRRSEHREAKVKLTYKEERDLETIDDRIARAEEKMESLNAAVEMAASDYIRLQKLSEQIDAAQGEHDALMERWLYLQEKLEAIEKQNEMK